MTESNDSFIGFRAETGEIYMLNKRERILVREILRKALTSEAGKQFLVSRFGPDSLKLAKTLLSEMEGMQRKS